MHGGNCGPRFAWAFGMRPEDFGFVDGAFWVVLCISRCGSFLGWWGQIARRSLRRRKDVRPGSPEVCYSPTARREAAPRLRDHQGNRGPFRGGVLTEPAE